jgi:hypothetical protein
MFWRMAFKGKPSINKRNREMALRERQKEKAARREARAAAKGAEGPATVMIDPVTNLPLSAEEQALREFKLALQERAAQEAADIENDLQRKK